MAALPKNIQSQVKAAVFREADEFGYMASGRIESGQFIDTLVEDPEVGRVLIEYMPKERVRTYIKDGILNAYTKKVTNKALETSTPEKTIKEVYGETAYVIQQGKGKQRGLFVLRSETGKIYVVSGGTVLKWETALRKALDIISNEKKLTINGVSPSICLKLSLSGQSLTEADKQQIKSAVGAVGVKAVFCGS